MSTQVGSPAGYNGRTKGLPEVQESVLEHATPETRKEAVVARVGDPHPEHKFLRVASVTPAGAVASWRSTASFSPETVRCFPLPQTRKDHRCHTGSYHHMQGK